MSHHHTHDFGRAFRIGIALNSGYIVVETLFGIWMGSLALLADAGHNLSDVLGLLIAWGAYKLVNARPSAKFTYGLGSSTILAALLNAMILLVAIGGISWEAIRRLFSPVETHGLHIMWVAGIGVVINTITAALFFRGHEHDLNIKGAFLHMAADAGVSLGVVLGGLIIFLTGAVWIDPALSLLIAFVILIGTWGLFRDSLRLAMHGVPSQINATSVEQYLSSLPGVAEVHDLHIWALSTTETALTAHLVMPDQTEKNDEFLDRVSEHLHSEFGIDHSTIQIESANNRQACDRAKHAWNESESKKHA